MINIPGSTRDYPLSYVGDCDIDFTDPLPGSDLSVSLYGELDSLTRPYKVRIDEKDTVERQLARLKGKVDFEFKGMALVSWTEREEGDSVVFNVQFRGCHNNTLPLPKFSGGFNRDTASLNHFELSGITNLLGSSVQLTYRAPFTQIKYVTRAIPKKPQFPKTVPVGDIIVEKIDGAQTGDVRINEQGFTQTGQFRLSGFEAVQIIEVDGPFYEQVGIYYECTETWRKKLQDAGQSARLVQL